MPSDWCCPLSSGCLVCSKRARQQQHWTLEHFVTNESCNESELRISSNMHCVQLQTDHRNHLVQNLPKKQLQNRNTKPIEETVVLSILKLSLSRFSEHLWHLSMRTSDDEMRRNGNSSQVLQFCTGLQLSLSQNKKQKNSRKNIGLKLKEVKKVRGTRPFFVWKHVRGRCHTALLSNVDLGQKSKVIASKKHITTISEKNGCCRIEMRPCEHDGPDRLVPPLEHPSPPDVARRLQPHTEFLTVPGVPRLLQVWIHLRRGAHRRIDGGVSLQRGPQRWELPAELVQRVAALVLDAFALRVLPQGSEQRLGHGLPRQTREVPSRALQQQAAQRLRGLPRSLRVWASWRFFDPFFVLRFVDNVICKSICWIFSFFANRFVLRNEWFFAKRFVFSFVWVIFSSLASFEDKI